MADVLTYLKEVITSFSWADNALTWFKTIGIILLALIVINFILNVVIGFIRKSLLSKLKTKKHISNIEILSKAIKYILLLILILVIVFSYTGSWTGLGISVGVLSAALAFALQRPITDVAAWIMIVTKRPFDIGDRISLGNVKGDVEDITLTHICMHEVGGQIQGQEASGATILVPNHMLFEQNLVNYTSEDEYVLDQVIFNVTYDSNMDKALNIGSEAARKQTKAYLHEVRAPPFVRMVLRDSGVDIQVRYYCPATLVHEVSSRITREIYDRVMESKDIEFAYPHMDVNIKK